jgi:hypothetical protein
MAFTYRGDHSNNRDRVRIDSLLTLETSWQRAVAAGFEALASAWQSKTSFSVFNGSYSRSDAARGYLEMAADWRMRHGEEGNATDELDAKTTDFSGDTVIPIFQREGFGFDIKDWDPA